MAKSKQITGVGYITLTGVATLKGRRIRNVHATKIGFCGTFAKAVLSKAAVGMKHIFEKQLREDYPEDEWMLKMSSRVTLVECDILLGGNGEARGE